MSRPQGSATLATREHVCGLYQSGLTQKEIAFELGITRQAVSLHLCNARRAGETLELLDDEPATELEART